MHELEVFILDEPRTVSTVAELAEVIASRIDGGNHFEIASSSRRFPMLDVVVREPYAVVHYFTARVRADTKRSRRSPTLPRR